MSFTVLAFIMALLALALMVIVARAAWTMLRSRRPAARAMAPKPEAPVAEAVAADIPPPPELTRLPAARTLRERRRKIVPTAAGGEPGPVERVLNGGFHGDILFRLEQSFSLLETGRISLETYLAELEALRRSCLQETERLREKADNRRLAPERLSLMQEDIAEALAAVNWCVEWAGNELRAARAPRRRMTMARLRHEPDLQGQDRIVTAMSIRTRFGRKGDYEIAACRLILAVALFVISIVDPEHVGFVSEPDDFLFLAYLLGSLAALAVARWWWWDFRLLPVFVTMDWLVYLAAPLVDESPMNGHLAAVLVLAVLILIETALRWNWRRLCFSALGLNLACWATCLALEWQMGHFDASHAVRRIALLLVITGVILAAVHSVRNWGPLLRMPPETPDRERAFAEALRLACRQARGRGAMLCWTDPDGSDCRLMPWGSAKEVLRNQDGSCCFRPIVDRCPSLFSITARHWLHLDESGDLRKSPMTDEERKILARIGHDDGIYLPLDNEMGKGSLVIFDMDRIGWSMAWLATEMAQAISRYLDDSMTLMRNQEVALAAQRQALARDLHDSVAQSLAGARFWLKSLPTQEDSGSVREGMDRIASAIDAEILNINTIIARLRRAELDDRQIALPAEMAGQCQLLSSHWRVAINLTAIPAGLEVSQRLAYDLFQMLREAVSNAVRHAGARNISVLLERIHGDLVCTVENDVTRPLPPRTPNPLSLVTRARDLGGHLQVMTSKGRVTIEIHLPVGEWA